MPILPTRIQNPLWEKRIRAQLWEEPYAASDNPPDEQQPFWSFDRFGQSVTELPDGRTLYIAGEHEDFYMPDFCIYNDIVVVHPDRSLEIYGYPEGTFPPTDFHSATLAGDQLILIGNTGYPEQRREGQTPVYCLDTQTLALRLLPTHGESPGWISRHHATLEEGKTIRITRGQCYRAAQNTFLANLDDWQLDIQAGRWERLTRHPWPRWRVQRTDQECNHLRQIRTAFRASRRPGRKAKLTEFLQELQASLGTVAGLALINQLYTPPVSHEALPHLVEEDTWRRIYRIEIAGVVVHYDETRGAIKVTVKGELPEAILTILQNDLCEKLSLLENTECQVVIDG